MIRKQFLRGTIEMVILELIARKEMYGFQILKELHTTAPRCLGVSEGTAYQILFRLEDRGLIKGRWEKQQRSGSGRKGIHIYNITKKGRKALNQRKAFWADLVEAVDRYVVRRASARAAS